MRPFSGLSLQGWKSPAHLCNMEYIALLCKTENLELLMCMWLVIFQEVFSWIMHYLIEKKNNVFVIHWIVNMLNCRAAEGDFVELPYRGPIKNTVLDLLGGLQSTCSYVGAKKLSQLQRKTVFVRVSRQHSGVFEAFRKLDWKQQCCGHTFLL